LDGAKLSIDGVLLDSSRVSSKGKLVLADVDASLVASPGVHTIQVVNPDGGTSTTTQMQVVAPDPDLRLRLAGNSAEEDLGSDLQFLVTGEGFDEDTKALAWGFRSTETFFISDSQLVVTIPARLLNDPARIPVVIQNRGERYSNAEIFFVVASAPEVGFVTPDSVEVGDEPFEITVRGANFKPGARLVVGGTPLETEIGKNGQLIATVPASFRAAPALLTVRVEQEDIQSSDLTIVVSPSSDPFIFSLNPSRIRIGEGKQNIEVNGANLGSDVVAFVDGTEVKIKGSTRRHLRLQLREELLQQEGPHTVEIRDEDGNASNIVGFVVVPDVTVSTIIGHDREGFNDGCVGQAEVRLRRPRRLAFGPDGLLYFTDQHNHAIRSLNVNTGEVCTVAGTGLPGYHDSDNPLGKAPTFSYPNGIAIDGNGTIYVTENGNSIVRRIRRQAGNITVDTFAGESVRIVNEGRQEKLNATREGLDGFRDGASGAASFRLPDDIIAAPDGSLYVADPNNHAVRRITISGGEVEVETIAGNGVPGFADGIGERVRFNTPLGLALSLDGNSLFVADFSNQRIRRINLSTRAVDTYAGMGDFGNIDGTASEATFSGPIGLAVDADGVLFVSELAGRVIRRIDVERNVSTLAGDPAKDKFRDGDGLRATFNAMRGIAVDRERGVLYVADYENFRIREIPLR
jgi:sugar lactone lactonase YvrE